MGNNDHIIVGSERLLFRPHVMADLDAFCAMGTDADMRRYVGGRPRTREEAENRFTNSVLKPAEGQLGMWATVLRSTGQYIGRCGVYPHFNDDGGVYEGEGVLGLYIATPYWGRGYATEAGQAFIKFGFDLLELNKIITAIDTRNAASVHVVEKLGFKLIRTEQGEFRSFYHYALTNSSNGPVIKRT